MTEEINLLLALEVANRAADAARQAILARYLGGYSVSAKPDDTPVTEADREAELAIRQVIQSSFPTHPILGEEYGGEETDGYCWVVDPIDGTVSFIHRVPLFCTLIALTKSGEALAAVVDMPALDRRFTAIAGQGSWEGNKRLHVLPGFDPRRSLVCHGDRDQFQAAGRALLYRQLDEQIAFFRSYTDAFGHCLVAAGSASLMVDPDLHPWDVAAPSLIVREAGGRAALHADGDSGLVTMLSGSPDAVEWVEKLL